MSLGTTNGGVRRRRWVCACIAVTVVGALAAVTAVRAGDAEARGTESWTRTVQPRLSAKQLGLPASTSARRLARAALRRSATRIGLPRSLAGLRLERDERVAPGPNGGVKLHSLRFRQTSGGRRVLWSQIEVSVSGGVVRSIHATVVPVKPGRSTAARPRISADRALAVARRAVAGPEQALTPQLVTYAGDPSRGRVPRLAYVIETLPPSESGAETPGGLCVVVDARTGKLLTSWRGHAAPSSGRSGSRHAVGARAAAVTRDRIVLLRDALVPSLDPPVFGLQTGSPYAAQNATSDSFLFANWDPSVFFFSTALRSAGMDTAIRNVRDVLIHMCFTRAYCSKHGRRDGRADGRWEPFTVTGNTAAPDALYIAFQQRVYLSPKAGHQNDVIAHEFGHLIDHIRSADSSGDHEDREVAEGIADMFAYDFDRGDATLAEDGPSGSNTLVPSVDWATPRNGQPTRMSQYRCNAEVHFNGTILSHAYFRLVQLVGHDVAGHLLYRVPALMGPNGRFLSAAGSFISAATAAYPNAPSVAAAARQAFVTEAGITTGPQPCPTAAPPSPSPPPSPPPAPVSDVAVPNIQGSLPGAARSALAAVGLALGTQRDVVDDNCVNVGVVVSQSPPAGTRVIPGTAINVTVGQLPRHPCP